MWRTKEMCADCPFQSSGPGLHLRKTLAKGRWKSILKDLRDQRHFLCHKTTTETGDGSNKVCAGSIQWQDAHGISSQFARICDRLDYFSRRRKTNVSGGN